MEIIAYKAFTAFDGIVIHDFKYGIEDKVIFSYQYDGENVGRVHKCTVYYNASGAAFFRFRGRREYLRDYLRI